MRFKNKVVLVTGGSRGIGAEIVKRFADEGAIVYFTYLSSKADAETVVRSIGKPQQVFYLACDVRKKEDVEKTISQILEKESSLDILVNNAGVIRDGLFLTMPDEDWSEVLETNLGGVYYLDRKSTRLNSSH